MLPPREDLNSGLVRCILKLYNSDDSVSGKKITSSEGLIIIFNSLVSVRSVSVYVRHLM